ncbi:MAG: class I SAM-dependent methyltransferase, partial [Desulfobacterales bacterium]|nr:class I SAM-dependent methyltransferase [Desulfobacterales bacterium]
MKQFKTIIKHLFSKGILMNYELPMFNAEQFSKDERLLFLEAKVSYLLDEVSSLRSLIRYLIADKIHDLPLYQQTKDSFNFQWGHLQEGHAMLSNEDWKQGVTDTICKFSNLPMDWFKGKRVMDAGCGQGRWTYGFGKLDVKSCVSFDISENGIAQTQKIAETFGSEFVVIQHNILEELNFGQEFDMVWCFGVLHHTGNTFKGFQNLVRLVKPG